jgi:protein involved in temperature-dependent protein secretion
MSVEPTRDPLSPPQSPKENWLDRLARLQELLTACPSDILSRCELAALLETMDMYEEALAQWKVVIVLDANHLNAREGLVRCHQKTEHHLTTRTVRRTL